MWGDTDVCADPADLPGRILHASASNEKDQQIIQRYHSILYPLYKAFQSGYSYPADHRNLEYLDYHLLLDVKYELLELEKELEQEYGSYASSETEMEAPVLKQRNHMNTGQGSKVEQYRKAEQLILDDTRKYLPKYGSSRTSTGQWVLKLTSRL